MNRHSYLKSLLVTEMGIDKTWRRATAKMGNPQNILRFTHLTGIHKFISFHARLVIRIGVSIGFRSRVRFRVSNNKDYIPFFIDI